jgi:hypothetical protein
MERKKQRGEMEGQDRGEIHRRRGGIETVGKRLRERDRWEKT